MGVPFLVGDPDHRNTSRQGLPLQIAQVGANTPLVRHVFEDSLVEIALMGSLSANGFYLGGSPSFGDNRKGGALYKPT